MGLLVGGEWPRRVLLVWEVWLSWGWPEMSYMLMLSKCELWMAWFSLLLCLGEAWIQGIVAGHSWVSFLGLGLWWFGWSEVMARGKAVGTLSSSCPCGVLIVFGPLWLWGIGDGGAVLVGIVARSDQQWGFHVCCILTDYTSSPGRCNCLYLTPRQY